MVCYSFWRSRSSRPAPITANPTNEIFVPGSLTICIPAKGLLMESLSEEVRKNFRPFHVIGLLTLVELEKTGWPPETIDRSAQHFLRKGVLKAMSLNSSGVEDGRDESSGVV